MKWNDPFFMVKGVFLIGKVNGSVYIKPGSASVEGYIAFGSYNRVFNALFLVHIRQEMSILQYHIRLCAHLRFLKTGEVLRINYFGCSSRRRVFYMKKGRATLFHQHHPPRKTVAFFSPIEFAG